MGAFQSKPRPPGIFSSNPPDTDVTPYTIRRHPKYASQVLQLPPDMPDALSFYKQTISKYGNRPYIGSRLITNGKLEPNFTFRTYDECYKISHNFAAGMFQNQVENRTNVCIFSENRPEWILTMDASYLIGFTTVALYDTFTTDSLEFSIKNCQAQYICISAKNFSKFALISDECIKQFRLIIVFDEIEKVNGESLARVHQLGPVIKTFHQISVEGEGKTFNEPVIDPEQLLYICYSSGTTGFPKGVMISHRAFITNLLGIGSEGTDYTFSRHLSYLPLCHVFERMCTSCVLLHGGCVGTFNGNVLLLTEDLAAMKPTVMPVVPRVLQRINNALNAKLAKMPCILRTLFECGWSIKKFMMNRELPYGLMDMIFFNKVKMLMGGQIEQICNGGAALPPELHERLQVIFGMAVRPGYGLSEGGSGNTINPPKIQHIKPGTSGYPLANVELRIVPVDDFTEEGIGEIQMGGTGLCSGYLNDPQATSDLFTDSTHQWIHTGDIGKFDEENSLVVVDRMRSIFKLSQGEYVAGDLLATFFEESPLVESIFVYGDSTKNFLVGIVIPAKREVAKLFEFTQMTDDQLNEAINSKKLSDAIMAHFTQISKEHALLGYQKVMKIKCVNDEWTVENGCLSPTFKPKRKVLTARYQAQIDELYQ